MKKTAKSPENVEVTPNKKKLKQARLPFMLLSDVSPKPESPATRKRKLSAPDAESQPKVGKIFKENNITEELLVISDDDSKGPPSPKKLDKPPNPYVKLVDTAWKKKIQKKGQKKSKTRSSKSKVTPENNASKDKSQSSECEDVEMVDVDVLIHEEPKQNEDNLPNGNVSDPTMKSTSTEETNNNSKNRKGQNSPEKNKDGISEDKTNALKKQNTVVSDIEGVVCIEDSNSSSDVQTVKQDSNNSKNEIDKTNSSLKDTKESSGNLAQKNKDESLTPSGKNDTKKRIQPITIATRLSPRKKDKKTDTPKQNKSVSDENQKSEESKMERSDEKDVPSDLEKQKYAEESPEKEPSEIVTPKQSARNKKEESNLNMSTTSSKLDESISSNPTTPKHNKSLSENSLLNKSMNDSLQSANLTPKQMQKKLEAAKKKEEKEKEKIEREKKRQQEKEEREKQRKEKEEQKKREREEKEDAKRREREEKEEQRKKEKEEKEKQKEMEKKARELKEEQKRKEREEKEEQRKKEKEARDEEKRKKQEALELEKQEQELKKKKAAEAFANFFVPKQKVERENDQEKGPVSKNSMLSSFTIKVDMRLAPTTRSELSDDKREILDKYLEEQNGVEKLYLKDLKGGVVKPMTSGKTWPLDEKDDDVIIVEDELPPIDGAGEVITCESAPREKLRPKLLSFHENRRPPYWGTWRKKSAFVTPRRPFGQEKILDYEVDSDDDWEDEADGESLDGSAGGSEDEGGADDYEVDNEVFVPHGYLSDEEATMDEDDVLSLSPETQKARLKHLEDEFESELKKPTEKLKPRLYGLLWENPEGGKPEKCVDALWNYFEKFAMIMNDITPLLQPAIETEDSEKKKSKKKKMPTEGEGTEKSPKSEKKKKQKTENKEKKPKPEVKKAVPNQPGINNFLKRVKPTQIA